MPGLALPSASQHQEYLFCGGRAPVLWRIITFRVDLKMNFIEALLKSLSKYLVYVATAAAVALTGFVILSSFMRHLLGKPFHFTEELVGLLFLAMVFLTFPFATCNRHHISVTLVTHLLPATGRKIAAVFGSLVFIAFTTWFFLESYKFTAFSHSIGARSEQSELLMSPWMAIMPITIGLVTVLAVVQLIRLLLSFVANHEEMSSSSKGGPP